MMSFQTMRVSVSDESGVGHARRRVVDTATELGIAAAVADRAALVVTELANNLVRHAGEGDILAQGCDGGLAVVAIDGGPGIANMARALEDGYSTGGTRGVGMGAIQRAADFFEIHSRPGKGTAALAIVRDSEQPWRRVAGVCVAKPGENVVGDAWLCLPTSQGFAIGVFDGLGHGPDAAAAAQVARDLLSVDGVELGLEVVGGRMHEALRATRGAAIALASVDIGTGSLTFMGVGNIAGTLVGDATKHLASHNGTAGGIARKFQAFTYPFGRDDVLVLMSDGIQTRWSLDELPGIAARHPMLIASAIFRDFARGTDDATVVVAKLGAS